AILGFSRILEEELEGEQCDMAQHISRGGERLMATLESLLTLSQLEAGTLKNERVLVPVYQTIEESVEPFVDRLHEKNVSLYVQCPRNLMVNVHPLLFSQCLHHLVSNAAKFTAEGEIVIKAFLNEGLFHLVVSDTGIGIPSDRLATIFQPFEQVSLGLNRLYEGSGLGLAISRKLVQMAGGGIQVTSEVGRGSTFSIDVPLKLPSAA
ncbi:MAG: HAMP domain-containing sensor histidine kinase, partial [Bacteroidota bacterium]